MHLKYRPDIDGLRAIAVLSVIAFHTFPNWVKGGFIGVDIFFVISGFLISTIIFKKLESQNFSFLEFYTRRVRRIFPALFAVLLVSFVFSWFALLSTEFKQLGKHIVGGIGFISNFVLWRESGYFDDISETKPLLHLWSLGIEEQFYILWPPFLWLMWKKRSNLLIIISIIGLTSFGLNIFKCRSDLTSAFFSPQTRFWELIAGSILAYTPFSTSVYLEKFKKLIYIHTIKKSSNLFRDVQSIIGLLLIIAAILLVKKQYPFPGFWALLPVLGTIMIIASSPYALINRIVLSNPILVWFGLISFPLYLWHWPLLAFLYIIEGESLHWSMRITSVSISLILAWITYKLIERPLRFGNHHIEKVIILVILMGFLGGGGFYVYKQNGLPFRKSIQETEKSLNYLLEWPFPSEKEANLFCQKYFGSKYKFCKLKKDSPPTVALIGDSMAEGYFAGLSNNYNKQNDNLLMLGVAGCPPLLGITSSFPGETDFCKSSMVEKALREVAKIQSIHTVILAANWHLYINGTRFFDGEKRILEIKTLVGEEESNDQVFSKKMKETIELLVNAGKKIIVIKQPPELNVSISNCLKKRPMKVLNKSQRCEVSSLLVKSYLDEYESIFDPVFSNDSRVIVLNPFSIFCNKKNCIIKDGIYPLYRDHIHLSEYGSEYLASRLKIFNKIN